MPDFLDQHYLVHEQYKDARYLNARILLHQRFSSNPYGWFKWVFDQFNLHPYAKILEIGCGPGMLWSENMARIPIGWAITLSDFSPGMVRDAKSNIGLNRFTFAFEVSNGMAIPFREETFDTIIANHVLYHFPDRNKALEEINRVLKPDGCFFASTIGENHLKELSQLTNDIVPGGNYYSPALNPSGFTLENGTIQLEPWFKQIEVRQYHDAMVITEAKPLVAYILSMNPRGKILPNNDYVANLSMKISQIIAQHGSIYIHKSTGMYICKSTRGTDNE
jgi:ubiquinone/menaquinone biosynthesis C-methylase UbiE